MKIVSKMLLLTLVAACTPASDTAPSETSDQTDWAPQIREANEVLLNQGDLERILMLSQLNQAYSTLAVVAFAEGIQETIRVVPRLRLHCR